MSHSNNGYGHIHPWTKQIGGGKFKGLLLLCGMADTSPDHNLCQCVCVGEDEGRHQPLPLPLPPSYQLSSLHLYRPSIYFSSTLFCARPTVPQRDSARSLQPLALTHNRSCRSRVDLALGFLLPPPTATLPLLLPGTFSLQPFTSSLNTELNWAVPSRWMEGLRQSLLLPCEEAWNRRRLGSAEAPEGALC